ncbi:MAG: AAA family ATPase [Hamadaea sp.]|uniref:helix-turn-helix transcriptional regulator n=1 Tax=Hamadaea sp. TaxID=2024425 RepID=UPI0017EB8165|nr:AAA family ATPase [Hamadaea sp.]NUR72832.1 AAA family ATPase [Hamadaea sp.]NUT20453.1 AAA family ATPase [Hamadaea sp.]
MAGSPPIAAPRLVGRDRELAALRAFIHEGIPRGDAVSGSGVALVEGEAGVGKSRLIRAALGPDRPDEARRPDGPHSADQEHRPHVLHAVCPPFREPLTLGTIVDALRQAVDTPQGLALTPLAGALRPVFPEWTDLLPPAPEPVADPLAARHRLLRALAELLVALGVRVLVVEDVHWADPATLEFLMFLAARPAAEVAMVVSYRPEDVPADSLLRRLAGRAMLRIELAPLDVADTARLISSMLGGEPVSHRFASFVHERTEGVPLSVEEAVRLMHARADLVRRGGRWVRRRLTGIAVSTTVREAVGERVDRLDPQARQLLYAAAVLSAPATEAVLTEVAGLSEEDALDATLAVLDSGLLVADERGRLAYRHELAARAVHDAIAVPWRRRAHARAARLLESVEPQPLLRLARHHREAGNTASWCQYAERAAERTLAAGDEDGAVALLLDLLLHADLAVPVVLRLVRMIPLSSVTDPARYRELARVLQKGEGADTAGDRAEALALSGEVLFYLQEYDAGRAALEAAIPGLVDRPAEAARAMMLLARPRGRGVPASMHRRWLERAAPLTHALAPPDRLRLVIASVTARLTLGDPAGWAAAAEIPDAPATPDLASLVTAGQLNLGHAALTWGRYADARARLDRARILAEQHEHLLLHDMIVTTRAHVDWFTGEDWAGLLPRVVALAGDPALQPLTRSEATVVIGQLTAATGDAETARAQFAVAIELAEQAGAVDHLVEPMAATARLLLRSGEVDEALRISGEAAEMIEETGLWLWAAELLPVRLDALVAAGRSTEAERLLALYAAGIPDDAPGAAAALRLGEAILRPDPDAFAAAADAYAIAARPYDALLARERHATCLLDRGPSGLRSAGLALLAEAAEGLGALGASADAARLRNTASTVVGKTVAGKTSAEPRRRGRPGYGDRLSPREVEVVRLVAAGQTNPQIAEALTLSVKTVGGHIESAMRKLRVSSRTALAVAAVEQDLLGPA